MRIEWLNANVPSANCRTAEGMRGSARRLASFSIAPGAALLDSAHTIAARHGDGRGRVQAAGAFADEAVLAALRAALPPDLAQAVRPRFEWYSCRGAHFHNDAHYGDVLFGAWCVAGPVTNIVFPRTGWRVASTIGTAIVFDPFESTSSGS